MMKAVVIGGCGHIGTYLVPKLVREGFDVVSISRGKSRPYHEDRAWREVERVALDREQGGSGAFEEQIAAMNADDVAQVFLNAITHRNQALGESFHAVSAESVTLLGYAQHMYSWFGKEPKIALLPWEEWCKYTGDEELCSATYLHIARSGSYSIEKGRRLIGYHPRHTALEAIEESVASMVERGVIAV